MDGELHERPYEVVCSSEDRETWLRARMGGIGASEAGACLGEHSRLSLAALVARKRGLVVEDDERAEWASWGLLHEPAIAKAYASPRYAHRPVERSTDLLRSKAHPWALATLDAWTIHPTHGRIPFEIKTTDYARDAWAEGPPPDYDWQLHQQMLVTGAPCASIACLLGPYRLVWCDVDRDETKIRRLIVAGREAWSLIRSDREPPAPFDRETFQAFWPRDDASEIELPEDFLEIDRERTELAIAKAAASKRLDEIDDEIRLAMKNAAKARIFGSEASYSLRTQRRNGTEFRVLRRHAPKEG